MKVVQIKQYSKEFKVHVNEIEQPLVKENEVLVKVLAAALNPLELLIMSGSIKLILDYTMPLTIGNELSGQIIEVGSQVHDLRWVTAFIAVYH